MGRRKLALELIANKRSRRTTYEKRKNGLIKKAKEFSILCGVDTCVILYGPDGGDLSTEPTTWPPSHQEVKRIVDRYQSEGKDHCTKRTTGLLEFFAMRKRKVDNELEKARLASLKAKYPVTDELIANITEDQRATLLATLATRLEEAKKLLAKKKQEATHIMNHGMMVDDLYYSRHNQYLQAHGMFQEQQTPLLVQPLHARPLLHPQYNPTSYLPPAIELEKENEWQGFGGALPNSNPQFYNFSPPASVYYPSMNMSSVQANSSYHGVPSLAASTSYNNNNYFNQNLPMGHYPSLNGPVQIDQPNQMAENAMHMFNPSSSSMFDDISTGLPLPTMMQYPFSASTMDARREN